MLPLSIVFGAATLLSDQGTFTGSHIFLLSLIAAQAGYMVGMTARDTFARLRLRANSDQPKRL